MGMIDSHGRREKVGPGMTDSRGGQEGVGRGWLTAGEDRKGQEWG